ncbi:MAG: hypothetical protein WBD47_13410 [Phormidesmis sp.]
MDGFSWKMSLETSLETPLSPVAPSVERAVAIESTHPYATPFQKALHKAVSLVVHTFKGEIERQQLYYHNLSHVQAVARRATFIFDTTVPFFKQPEDEPHSDRALSSRIQPLTTEPLETDWSRQRELLYLSAIAHDMVQLFLPERTPHTSRQRESGRSESITFDRLLSFIEQINNQATGKPLSEASMAAPFTTADVEMIREAIDATVCEIDPVDGGIYQPLLYQPLLCQSPLYSTRELSLQWLQQSKQRAGQYNQQLVGQPLKRPAQSSLSLVARCLALADIGTLGIDGIDAYRREGSLLLLEENLDMVSYLCGQVKFSKELQEGLRQRLLKRARFQVAFARSRLDRLDRELQGFPEGAIALLKRRVFRHLTPQTIEVLAEITPTAEETSLSTLLAFFHLSEYL